MQLLRNSITLRREPRQLSGIRLAAALTEMEGTWHKNQSSSKEREIFAGDAAFLRDRSDGLSHGGPIIADASALSLKRRKGRPRKHKEQPPTTSDGLLPERPKNKPAEKGPALTPMTSHPPRVIAPHSRSALCLSPASATDELITANTADDLTLEHCKWLSCIRLTKDEDQTDWELVARMFTDTFGIEIRPELARSVSDAYHQARL